MPGLASAAIFAGTASAGEVFTDEFDSPSLDGKWTVLRPSDSNFAVENSQLLLISSKPGGLSDNTVENVLMPNVELPGGDWTMTVNFSGEFQTAREELGIGVMGTETCYLMAGIVKLGDQYYSWSLSAQIGRTLNKDFHGFQRSLAGMGCNLRQRQNVFRLCRHHSTTHRGEA